MDSILIDTHCHLNYGEMGINQQETINNSKKNNVKGILHISVKMQEWDNSQKTAHRYDNVWYSIGVHPCNIKESEHFLPKSQDIIKYIYDEKAIAIGECGLDYFYDDTNKELQQHYFIEHIKAGQKTGIPIVVHTRDAQDDTIRILKEQYLKKPFKAVIHCFTGDEKLLQEALNLGFYISASGIVTFKNSIQLQETIKKCPLNKLLLETDSPYLSPIPMRGKPNFPAHIKYTAKFMSELLNISYKELSAQTTNNFFNLFNKAKDTFIT